MRSIPNSYTPSSSIAPTASLSAAQRSPWHSPVPYLFGGLAAMLGLITCALLILACSYWKLSGLLHNEQGSDRDLERGDGEKHSDSAKNESVRFYKEKILVIMAGDQNPTFLATPVCSKSSSFGDGNGKDGIETNDNSQKPEKERDVQEVTIPTENEGTQRQNQ